MESWIGEPRRLNTDTQLQRLLNLEWGVEDQAWVRLGTAGLWDCVPVGRILPAGTRSWQRTQVLVLRLVPGRALERCPLALACDRYGESAIIADHREELLPSWVFERLRLDKFGVADGVRARPDAEWQALCEAWGCDLDRAARIRRSLEDPEIRASMAGAEGFEGRTDAISALRAWCAGQPREALARYVEVVSASLPWEAPDLDSAGAWREPLLLFSATPFGGQVPEDHLLRARLEALRVPMPHEAAYQFPNLRVGPCAGTAWQNYSIHYDIAKKVLETVDSGGYLHERQGPLGPLITAAIVFATTGPSSYDGQAHLDAASALAEAGDLEGSLNALLTAISWQRAQLGAPLRSSLNAWIEGTREAGPRTALHHELALRYRDILETAERLSGRALLG